MNSFKTLHINPVADLQYLRFYNDVFTEHANSEKSAFDTSLCYFVNRTIRHLCFIPWYLGYQEEDELVKRVTVLIIKYYDHNKVHPGYIPLMNLNVWKRKELLTNRRLVLYLFFLLSGIATKDVDPEIIFPILDSKTRTDDQINKYFTMSMEAYKKSINQSDEHRHLVSYMCEEFAAKFVDLKLASMTYYYQRHDHGCATNNNLDIVESIKDNVLDMEGICPEFIELIKIMHQHTPCNPDIPLINQYGDRFTKETLASNVIALTTLPEKVIMRDLTVMRTPDSIPKTLQNDFIEITNMYKIDSFRLRD